MLCIEISPTDDDSSPFFELSIVFKNYTRVYVLGMGRRDLLNDAELISLTIDKPLWLAKTKAD
ncbi:hypothetical protein DU002_11420 [Corallincola holothuriorum]|uniref:Uncharacterized protein n=1 Tax=Corallincola holothuriorum TaxID=2282215 RepID=A0A368NHC3_9GAMM|nr:hypothetical protein DU002_11420 [Corallincola holothuriorum]